MPRISRRADRCEGSKSDVALNGSGLNFARAEPVDDAVTPGAHSVHCREASHRTIGETGERSMRCRTKAKKKQKMYIQSLVFFCCFVGRPRHRPRAAVLNTAE